MSSTLTGPHRDTLRRMFLLTPLQGGNGGEGPFQPSSTQNIRTLASSHLAQQPLGQVSSAKCRAASLVWEGAAGTGSGKASRVFSENVGNRKPARAWSRFSTAVGGEQRRLVGVTQT